MQLIIHLIASVKAQSYLVAGFTAWAFSLLAISEDSMVQLGAAGIAIGGLGYLLKVILDFLLKWKEVKSKNENPSPDVIHKHLHPEGLDKLGTLIDQTGLRLEAVMNLNEKLGVMMTDVQVIKQIVESNQTLSDERHKNVHKMIDKLFKELEEVLKRSPPPPSPSDSTIR